jgi:PAS fold
MDTALSKTNGDDTVARALAGGSPQGLGTFRFYFEDERWEWCEQVQRLHGYEPGTVTPTTELVLSHKHPDDRNQIAATLDDIRRTHGPFSTRHRIIDVQGNVHQWSWWLISSSMQRVSSLAPKVSTSK